MNQILHLQEFTEFEIDSDADRENDRRHEEADKSDSGDDSDVQVGE